MKLFYKIEGPLSHVRIFIFSYYYFDSRMCWVNIKISS